MTHMRRDFLLGVGAAVGGMALAAPRAAAGSAPAGTALLATYVAGTAYHEARSSVSGLRPGDRLDLRREPENSYDARAIQVRTMDGAMLGYVPRADNQALCSLMDAGFALEARASSLIPDPRQPEIRLDVLLLSA